MYFGLFLDSVTSTLNNWGSGVTFVNTIAAIEIAVRLFAIEGSSSHGLRLLGFGVRNARIGLIASSALEPVSIILLAGSV